MLLAIDCRISISRPGGSFLCAVREKGQNQGPHRRGSGHLLHALIADFRNSVGDPVAELRSRTG